MKGLADHLRSRCSSRPGFAWQSRPAQQRRFAERRQSIKARLSPLEPAVDVAQQNTAGIGRGMLEILRPAGTRPQAGRTSERPLSIGRHHRLAGRAAGRGITSAPIVLAENPPAPLLILPRAVGTRLGQHLDPIPVGVDRQQAKTNKPTEPMHPPVPIATASRRRHGKPNLISRAGSVHRLQQEIEAEPELHLDDRQPRRLLGANGDDVTAANLALDGEPRPFEESLHGWIKSGLGHSSVLVERRTENRNGSNPTSRRKPGLRPAIGAGQSLSSGCVKRGPAGVWADGVCDAAKQHEPPA
jgi:hypothetical protein